PSAFCYVHKNCAPCPGGAIPLQMPRPGELGGKKQEIELSSCFTEVSWPYGHHIDVDRDAWGHVVRVNRTGETFFVLPGEKGKALNSATRQGTVNYLSFSGIGTIEIAIDP